MINNNGKQNTYTGTTTFIYTSKYIGDIDLEKTCEVLGKSNAFGFAMTNQGKIYYKNNGKLKSDKIYLDATITGEGMTVKGHDTFMKANEGTSSIYAFSIAINAFLSEQKLFNSPYGFPNESAKAFMGPIAIKYDSMSNYELVMPYFKIYKCGTICLSLKNADEFENLTTREVIQQTNKSRIHIESLLCGRELYLACVETMLSQTPKAERLCQRDSYTSALDSALAAPKNITFLDDQITAYELVQTDKFTLTDLARNLLSLVARAVSFGAVQTRIRWHANQYINEPIGQHWRGKPIINIRTHSKQLPSSAMNWSNHKQLVNSILARTPLPEDYAQHIFEPNDMRQLDDYNNFYSESVSLLLSSSQVTSFIENNDSYSFDNLTSDIQCLNEAAHYILTFYSYASLELDKCKTAIDVARTEMKIMEFEESLLSAQKFGEVAKYIEEIQKGDQLKFICKTLHKKIETTSKAFELDEKIASESFNRSISIIFGVMASAILSPELMQPLAKYISVASADENINKLMGIIASTLMIASVVALTHCIYKIKAWMSKRFKRI
ncbi:hypothetical protein V2I49_25060 [Pseudomonas viridiflava]|uniref:hypothetical protein n=1 Tax=Pseudomonas viridiflava TaxID=33069 RepID=UPI002EB2A00B|nr:hypothetical protein [Pseudomonas viridiflava]